MAEQGGSKIGKWEKRGDVWHGPDSHALVTADDGVFCGRFRGRRDMPRIPAELLATILREQGWACAPPDADRVVRIPAELPLCMTSRHVLWSRHAKTWIPLKHQSTPGHGPLFFPPGELVIGPPVHVGGDYEVDKALLGRDWADGIRSFCQSPPVVDVYVVKLREPEERTASGDDEEVRCVRCGLLVDDDVPGEPTEGGVIHVACTEDPHFVCAEDS